MTIKVYTGDDTTEDESEKSFESGPAETASDEELVTFARQANGDTDSSWWTVTNIQRGLRYCRIGWQSGRGVKAYTEIQWEK